MTQCEKVIRHLEDYGSLSSMEAVQEYGIMRLASRVSDLKRLGFPVKRVMESSKNRYGESVCYARYYLEGKDGTAS